MGECKKIVFKYIDEEYVVIDNNIIKFFLVGFGMKNIFGVVVKVFKIFNENGIMIKFIIILEICIICVINFDDK